MECEICGGQIFGRAWSMAIDGAKLIVCSECAKSFKSAPQMPKQQTTVAKKPSSSPKTPPIPQRQTLRRETMIWEDLELVEDYKSLVRKARESMDLTHDVLSRKIGERVSVLQKLETGKMIPDQALARKLEHTLKIKLLQSAPKVSLGEFKGKPLEPTLGDIVAIQQKKNDKVE